MGATCHYGFRTIKELHNHNVDLMVSDGYEVLASTLKGNWGIYALNQDGRKFVEVIKYSKIDNEVCERSMSESMGPCYYDVPLKYLDLTDHTTHERNQYALEWRKEVREAHARAKLANKVDLIDGMEFCLYDQKYTYQSGCKYGMAYNVENGTLYRLTAKQLKAIKEQFLPTA